MARPTPPPAPVALVVFLENLGAFGGIPLPRWVSRAVDFVSEEYVKLALRLHGVHRRYARVEILEDARATGPDLAATLVALSRSHRVDLMILCHGLPEQLIGHEGKPIGWETWTPLLEAQAHNPQNVRLRVVWQMNCYGATLAPVWQRLGARSVNGSLGVNWLPEPTLSLFLRGWLQGAPFSEAVYRSARRAERTWKPIYRSGANGALHPHLASSRPIIVGEDCTIRA